MNFSDIVSRMEKKRGTILRRIYCKDGFNFSLQASKYHYCLPKSDDGPYTHFEIGYPSKRVKDFMPYITDVKDNPINAVYAFVPNEIVEKVITDHGGMCAFLNWGSK